MRDEPLMSLLQAAADCLYSQGNDLGRIVAEGIERINTLERELAKYSSPEILAATEGELVAANAAIAALRAMLEEYVCDEDERGEVELTCVRCRPGGPFNIPGTVCRYHAAKSLLSQGNGSVLDGLAHYVPPCYERILWRGSYYPLPMEGTQQP